MINLRKRNLYTQSQVEELISNITIKNMTVPQAAKSVDILYSTAVDYYKCYKRTGKIPVPRMPGYSPRRKVDLQHTEFIGQQIAEHPDITKKELLVKLNNAFPTLNLAPNTFGTYIRKNFPQYNSQSRKGTGKRIVATIRDHSDFTEKIREIRPKMVDHNDSVVVERREIETQKCDGNDAMVNKSDDAETITKQQDSSKSNYTQTFDHLFMKCISMNGYTPSKEKQNMSFS